MVYDSNTSRLMNGILPAGAGSVDVILAANSKSAAVWLYHRRNPDSPWQRQPMAANEDNAWMAQIPLSEDVQYYVVAENKYIAALSPARAANEFYEIKAK